MMAPPLLLTPRARWWALAALVAVSASAQPAAPAEEPAPYRLGLGTFESAAPKLTGKDLLKLMAAALKKRAAEKQAKFVLALDPQDTVDLTLSAKVAGKGTRYSITFLLSAGDDPDLTSHVIYPVGQGRVTPAGAAVMANTVLGLAAKLDVKRVAKAKERAVTAPPPGDDKTDPGSSDDVPPQAEEEPDPLFRFALHGFLQAQGIAVGVDKDALLNGIVALRPSPRAFLQGNLQPQLSMRGDHFSLNADLSLVGSTAAPIGLFLINELYANAQYGPVRVLVGRRRIVWGSGLAVNPTDILNPQKDALTPDLQRTGALLLPMIDVTLGPVTLTGVISLGIDTNTWALPKGVLTEKAIFAGRVYALIAGTDLNAMYYRDQEHKRNLFGLAASRFIGDWVELHLEVLVRASRPELPALPYVPGCGDPLERRSGDWTGTGLFGARVHFEDQGLLVAEYFYNGDGLDASRYDQLKDQTACIAAAVASIGGPTETVPNHPLGFPAEQLFLVREHHFFLTYERPHLDKGLFEDVSLTAGAIFSPADFSVILQAGAGYNFGGHAQVNFRMMYWAGGKNSEIGAWPARVLGVAGFKVSF